MSREVMTDVFLESPPALSTMSALFIGWGQLLAFDLSLTSDNSSEPLDIDCNDGESGREESCCGGQERGRVLGFRPWTSHPYEVEIDHVERSGALTLGRKGAGVYTRDNNTTFLCVHPYSA